MAVNVVNINEGETKRSESVSQQVHQVIENDDPSRIYSELVPLLATLSVSDFDIQKDVLKAHFKRKLSVSNLDKAIKEYRKRQSHQRLTRNREKSQRPTIEVGGHLRDLKNEALTALNEWNTPPRIFVQSGRLVTITLDEEQVPSIKPLSLTMLEGFMSESADYVNVIQTADSIIEVPTFPPANVVKGVLDGYSPHEYPFPPLEGVTELPIIRPDGTIYQIPGYDAVSKHVYFPGNLIIPTIADTPSTQDVQEACKLINEQWLGDFPFVDDASRATVVAMAITVVIRLFIKGQVPLALLDAPKQGSGKTLIAQAIAILATGKIGVPNPPTQDEEETRKRVLTWLQQSPATVIIDNITFPLESSALNMTVSSPVVGDRLLSTNTNVTVKNRAVWFAIGNNLRVGDDTARRCVKARLDAKMERPHKRDTNQFRIKGGVNGYFEWTIEHRGQLVAAILTIVRHWIVQGRKLSNVVPIGNFEEWTVTLGGILQCANIPGFLENLDENGASTIDDVSAEWAVFFEAIHRVMGSNSFTLQALAKEMLKDGDDAINNMLPASLSKNYGTFRRSEGVDRDFSIHMGYAFRARRDQIHNGYILKQSGKDRNKIALWTIVREEPTPPTLDRPKYKEVTAPALNHSENVPDDHDTLPLLESEDETREMQSVQQFLAKCTTRGVRVFLGETAIEIESPDSDLAEKTRAYIAKHEIAVTNVLTLQIVPTDEPARQVQPTGKRCEICRYDNAYHIGSGGKHMCPTCLGESKKRTDTRNDVRPLVGTSGSYQVVSMQATNETVTF